MTTELGKILTYLKGLLPTELIDPWATWSCEIMWQIKPLHLHQRNAYCQETWQNGDLPWAAPTHKPTWAFDQVINYKHYISTTKVPMVTERGKMVTYLKGFLRKKLLDPWVARSCKITWQIKIIASLLL